MPEPVSKGDAITTGGKFPLPAIPRIPLGAELPVFCERCGYSLHALPQTRCGHCSVLQFHCPECGHHQPINTLRPAMQNTLGRLRAWALCWSIFFRLNFFGWLLFFWGIMGVVWSYQVHATQIVVNAQGRVVSPQQIRFEPRLFDMEAAVSFVAFGFGFGLFGRMLLLRWRRAWAVGLALGVLVVTAIACGAWFHWEDRGSRYETVSPFNFTLATLMLIAFSFVFLGAVIVWPIWVGFVKIFVPARAGEIVLAWQRSMSEPAERASPANPSALSRD